MHNQSSTNTILSYFLFPQRSIENFILGNYNQEHQQLHGSYGMKAELTIEQQALCIQHDPVPTLCQSPSNLPRRLKLPQLQKPLIRLDSLTNQFRTSSFTLSLDDNALLLLNSLVDQESSTLSNLLSDLLGLDGMGEFGGEGDVSNGNVVENEVEPPRPAGEVFTHKTGDHLALGDELGRVELGDDGFEDFVDDRREDAFVVVGTELSIAGETGVSKRGNGIGKQERGECSHSWEIVH